jgi:hypothetical protein
VHSIPLEDDRPGHFLAYGSPNPSGFGIPFHMVAALEVHFCVPLSCKQNDAQMRELCFSIRAEVIANVDVQLLGTT